MSEINFTNVTFNQDICDLTSDEQSIFVQGRDENGENNKFYCMQITEATELQQ